MELTRRLLASLILVPLLACAQLQEPNSWQSPELQDHPLAGRVWDVNAQRFLSVAELSGRLTASRILLLGEKHDNPDHHVLQQRVMEFLLQSGRLNHITFEMMDDRKQDLLDSIHQQSIVSLDTLKNYLQWDEQGWAWEFYGPLLQTALRSGAAIRAGNISDATVGQVYSGDIDTATLNVLDEPARARLHEIIDESHCGLLPQSQFPA
ncbi:MAG: ChaN family lipoprotein, partial [Gammaproteobacteria bacterium]